MNSRLRMLGAMAVLGGLNVTHLTQSVKQPRPIGRCYSCGTRMSGTRCPGCKRELSGVK